ncbi:unnamed protein product [Leuciscus chuanchicus]
MNTSLSATVPMLMNIKKRHLVVHEDDSAVTKTLKITLTEEIDRRWELKGRLLESSIYIKAAILDPRFKKLSFFTDDEQRNEAYTVVENLAESLAARPVQEVVDDSELVEERDTAAGPSRQEKEKDQKMSMLLSSDEEEQQPGDMAVISDGRVVKVPVGPLMHVEGQAVSIRCNVSDYQGPRDQDFEWSMIQSGDKSLNLISTFDDGFIDPTVKDRVNSEDISYKKLGDNSVELRFKKVRATDSGVYRCITPSTDSVISGNYHADVELKVIGDSLKVSPAIPKSAVSEGESVELRCNTTRGFTEHTFLSVSWSIKKESGLLEEILTFGPDDKIKVGSNYIQRYTDGGLRLDLRGGGFYGLVLKRAKPSDQGEYVCSVQEWMRQGEGGRNWRKIQEKSKEIGKVVVKPTVAYMDVSMCVWTQEDPEKGIGHLGQIHILQIRLSLILWYHMEDILRWLAEV